MCAVVISPNTSLQLTTILARNFRRTALRPRLTPHDRRSTALYNVDRRREERRNYYWGRVFRGLIHDTGVRRILDEEQAQDHAAADQDDTAEDQERDAEHGDAGGGAGGDFGRSWGTM